MVNIAKEEEKTTTEIKHSLTQFVGTDSDEQNILKQLKNIL